MHSNEVDTLYMGLIALGQFIESAMDDVDINISRLAQSLEPAE